MFSNWYPVNHNVFVSEAMLPSHLITINKQTEKETNKERLLAQICKKIVLIRRIKSHTLSYFITGEILIETNPCTLMTSRYNKHLCCICHRFNSTNYLSKKHIDDTLFQHINMYIYIYWLCDHYAIVYVRMVSAYA